MSWDEIVTRTAQAFEQQVDATRHKIGVPAIGITSLSSSPKRGSFFFRPSEISMRVDAIRKNLQEEMEEVIERANRICEHQFDLLGYSKLSYGKAIDWNLDAVHGKRAPQKPWFKIQCLSFDEVGDVKITWELNRHQHLVVLARAYLFTRDETYLHELVEQWMDWQRKNPYPIGINWASSLEVAFRSLSWLWIRHLLSASSIVQTKWCTDLDLGLALHGRHIRRFLSTYFSPNTHLLGEAVALFFLGTLCCHRDAKEWAACGWDIVLREAERQVGNDGMHFEQSTYYHVYALDLLLHARILAARNGMKIPLELDGTLKRMLSALSVLGHGGSPPRLGDDDGGRVFDPKRNCPQELLDPLCIGAALFDRSDLTTVPNEVTEEAIWLLGPDATEAHTRSSSKTSQPPDHLGDSGIYLAATRIPVSQRMVIDAGPMGIGRGGHGHADALSIHLAAHDHEWLVDPGAFQYVGPGNDREEFRKTGAHNTLEVDGLSQSDPDGTFAWRALPKTRVTNWTKGNYFHFFSGEHDGYGRFSEPVIHQRSIFRTDSSLWMIRDRVEGTGLHSFAINWHFAPELRITLEERCVTATDDNGQQLTILLSNPDWDCEIVEGWVSRVYGAKQPAQILRLSRRAKPPVESGALLRFHSGNQFEVGTFDNLSDERDPIQRYRRTQRGCYDEIIFGSRGRAWEMQPYSTDAELLHILVDTINDREGLILLNSSYLQISDRNVVTLPDDSCTFEYQCAHGTEEFEVRPDVRFDPEALRSFFTGIRSATVPEFAAEPL